MASPRPPYPPPASPPRPPWWRRVADLYIDGFRSMTVGRQLWALIIVKLIFIFFVLKLLLMPDLLHRDYSTDTERAAAVRSSLIERNTLPKL